MDKIKKTVIGIIGGAAVIVGIFYLILLITAWF